MAREPGIPFGPGRPLVQRRITNNDFDPHVMLRKAIAGVYPSAENRAGNEQNRAAEIAYWRNRCEQAGRPEEDPT